MTEKINCVQSVDYTIFRIILDDILIRVDNGINGSKALTVRPILMVY